MIRTALQKYFSTGAFGLLQNGFHLTKRTVSSMRSLVQVGANVPNVPVSDKKETVKEPVDFYHSPSVVKRAKECQRAAAAKMGCKENDEITTEKLTKNKPEMIPASELSAGGCISMQCNKKRN